MRRKKIPTTCQSCHSKKVSLFLSANKFYSLYKCSDCSVVFTFPQPKATKLINQVVYDSKKELESRIANFPIEYQRARVHVLNFMKYKKSGKYLDVGCSYGIGLKAAHDLGFDVIGVEPTKKAANYARKHFKLEIIEKTLEKAKIKSNTFDVISLYDVLEHVPNLHKFLTEIRRILKPEGLLVIQSPNIESYAFKLLTVNWNWLLVPNHLWHFSKKSISKLLKENGFLVEKFITEDVVYDFSSNFKSKIFHYRLPKYTLKKVFQKLTFLVLYGTVYICTLFWSQFEKGGTLQIYAIKK